MLVRGFRILFLLVFATLPLALVGGVIAVLMTGGVVSLGALVGFDGRFNVHPTPGFSWSTVF